MQPRLKTLNCLQGDGELLVGRDPKVRIRIADPDGRILALLRLLQDGRRSLPEITRELQRTWPAVTHADLTAAIAQLDRLGWMESTGGSSALTAREQERYASNLAFFGAFSSLDTSREEYQSRLRDAHVLVLGAGGLGSAVLMNLAGLGVGALTVVDQDLVELRNFARQFTYAESDLGQSKAHRVADWLRAFDSTLRVESLRRRVESTEDVDELLLWASAVQGPVDLVVSAIDEPDEIDLWVNRACVGLGVPFVRGGLAYTQGLYWSVDPGRSPCRECLELHRDRLAAGIDREAATWPSVLRMDRANRAIGPVAGVLGGLMAMEAMRYLTEVVPPVSAGRYQLVDFATDCGTSSDPWPAAADCPVCRTAPLRCGEAPELAGAAR